MRVPSGNSRLLSIEDPRCDETILVFYVVHGILHCILLKRFSHELNVTRSAAICDPDGLVSFAP